MTPIQLNSNPMDGQDDSINRGAVSSNCFFTGSQDVSLSEISILDHDRQECMIFLIDPFLKRESSEANMHEGWLNCRVGKGMFSNEYMVEGETFDHTKFTLFAPDEAVDADSEPIEWELIPARLRVRLLGNEGAKYWIQLPGESVEMGYVILVNPEQLTPIPHLQEA